MHPEMLKYYEKELQFIRGMGKEFAERYPGVAKRLDLGGFECADPYVERLLEGFAFLTARIQLKLDAEFPKFTQNLLSMIYPHYLAPLPSMTIMQFEPDLAGGVTEAGFNIPRGTRLRSELGKNSRTRCDFRTAHAVDLWPLQITHATYLQAGEASHLTRSRQKISAGISLHLTIAAGFSFNTLTLDKLAFYIDGGGETPTRIYELLLAHCATIVVQPVQANQSAPTWKVELPPSALQSMGFEPDQALLPYTDVSFQGYRYLQEYFAFPQRFLFVEINGLQQAISRCTEETLEIAFLFNEKNDFLQSTISQENFALNCTPAINLFPKRGDRIHLSPHSPRHHVIMDRTSPLDYEVYSLTNVTGFDSSLQEQQHFKPFYGSNSNKNTDHEEKQHAFYTLHRSPRITSSTTRHTHTDYIGTEVFISLVDATETPYAADLKQLGIQAWCTNRDLPLQITSRRGKTLFSMEDSAPVIQVRSLAGPTPPKPPHAEGENAWRLISHLSLNYLSLLDKDEQQGATALRELLTLYSDLSSIEMQRQIDGVLSVSSKPTIRRIPGAGPITFGRGIEITLNCKESAFEGTGIYLLGTVLERFFAKYVSLNSFTQTRLKSVERGNIMQWPVRTGTRATL
jgi:type VI secretion system protein ImpG